MDPSSSPSTARLVWLLRFAVACYVVYAVLLTLLSLEGFPTTLAHHRPWPYLADLPLGDDGYYMMTVAWNIARGEGITYNFSQPTTGIQPLATFLFAGLAFAVQRLGGDRFDFARTIIAAGALTQLLLSHLVAALAMRLARITATPSAPPGPAAQQAVYPLAFTMVLCNTEVFAWATYGLETCIYLCLLCLFVSRFVSLTRAEELSLGAALELGAVVGLSVLARLDFVVVSPLLLLLLAWRWRSRLFRLLAAGLVALVIVAPWLVYVYRVSGSPMPSSGYAQGGLPGSASEAGARLAHAAIHSVLPSLPWTWNPLRGTSASQAPTSLLLFCTIPVILVLLVLVTARGFWTALRSLSKTLLPVLLAFAISTATYAVLIRAVWFYPRYLLFWIVALVPLMAVLIARAGLDSPPRALPFRSLAIAVALATFLYGVVNTYNAGQLLWQQSIFTGLVKDRFAHVRVGAFQSGVVGYFNPNTFNLDGKLDHIALAFLKQGRISRYIEEKGIDVLIDWDQQFAKFMGSAEEQAYLAASWQRFTLENPSPRGARLRFYPSSYYVRRPAGERAGVTESASRGPGGTSDRVTLKGGGSTTR